jgi:MFS family permease
LSLAQWDRFEGYVREIFRMRTLMAANLVGLLVGAGLFSQFYLLSLYMQQILGYSALRTSVAYVASTFAVIVFSGIGQSLVTRLGVKPVLTTGLVLTGAAIGLFYTRLPVAGSYFGDLFLPLVLAGIGLGFTFVPMSIAALMGVTPRDAGLASGLINTSPQIGGAIGLAVASTLATTFANRYVEANPGTPALSPDATVSGFHVAFAVQAALILAAAGVAALIIPRRVSPAEVETEETELVVALD